MAVLKISDLMESFDGDQVVFRISEPLKHHRRGSLGLLAFSSYQLDVSLDVVRCIREYIARTEELRGKEDRFFITTRPPYQGASKPTLARWVREGLTEAGVPVNVWSAHSVRSASTSKLSKIHVPIEAIMAKAQWKCANTFREYYEKPIVPKDVAHHLLDAFVKGK